MIVAQHGFLDVVTYLVEEGANVNAINKDGLTSQMIADRKGHLDVTKYLAEKMDQQAADEKGNSNRVPMQTTNILEVCQFNKLHVDLPSSTSL